MSSVQDFKSSFKGQIATEDDPDYSIAQWAKNAERKVRYSLKLLGVSTVSFLRSQQAKYVAYPVDAEDVSRAILFAKSSNLQIAIRGGGHSTSGTSAAEGGLVIDLSKHLNNVRIDPGNKLAYVQGGAIWETVDKAAMGHGICLGDLVR